MSHKWDERTCAEHLCNDCIHIQGDGKVCEKCFSSSNDDCYWESESGQFTNGGDQEKKFELFKICLESRKRPGAINGNQSAEYLAGLDAARAWYSWQLFSGQLEGKDSQKNSGIDSDSIPQVLNTLGV